MTDRTVAVELMLVAKRYIDEMDKAERKTEDFGDTADRTKKRVGTDFDGMGKSSSEFERILTKNLRDGETAIQSIGRRSSELRTELTKLRADFQKTGSSETFAGIKKAEADLHKLGSIAKTAGLDIERELTSAVGGSGDAAGKTFLQGIQKVAPVFGNPVGLAVGAALVAGISPVVVAGFSAAIAGGAGLGLIGAAALIRKGDPRLQSAFGILKTDAVATFQGATIGLEQPFINALGYADQLVKKEGPQLAATFDAVAPSVNLISHGLGRIASDELPAITKLAEGFSTALHDPTLQGSVIAVDNQFGNLFRTIGSHPQEIADGFHAISTVIDGGVATINTITSAYAKADATLHQWHDDLEKFVGKAPKIPQGGASSAPPGLTLAQSHASTEAKLDALMGANKATPAILGLGSAMSTLAKNTMQVALSMHSYELASIDSQIATNDFNTGLTQASKLLKENKGDLRAHTEAGEADRGALLGLVAQAKSMLPAGKNLSDLTASQTKAYNRQIDSVAGLITGNSKNDVAMRKLINSYKSTPKNVTTNVKATGTTQAQKDIAYVQRALDALHNRTIHVSVQENISQATLQDIRTGQHQVNRWGGAYEHALDGVLSSAQIASPVMGRARYAYAEPATGGEAFVPRRGDAERSMSILNTAASWYGSKLISANSSGASGGGASYHYDHHVEVYPQKANFTVQDLNTLQQVQAVRQRLGHPR